MGKADEVFADLLEDYLDDRKIAKKKQMDYDEMAKEEKQLEIARGLSPEDTITIYSFLRDYLHTRTNGDSEITLSTLKTLGLPTSFVMGVHENLAKNNPELVRKGILLLVKDNNRNRGTYINPQFISQLLDNDALEVKLKKFANPQEIDLEDLGDYYDEYQELLKEKEANDATYSIIKQAHKVKKFNKLKEMMGKSDNND